MTERPTIDQLQAAMRRLRNEGCTDNEVILRLAVVYPNATIGDVAIAAHAFLQECQMMAEGLAPEGATWRMVGQVVPGANTQSGQGNMGLGQECATLAERGGPKAKGELASIDPTWRVHYGGLMVTAAWDTK